MQISFVGFQPVQSSEHMAVSLMIYTPPFINELFFHISLQKMSLFYCLSLQALGVFGLCQVFAFIEYVRSKLSAEQFNILFRFLVLVSAFIATLAFGIATALGSILSR